MFVLTLAPLTALPQPSDQLLHYFSKEKCSAGQLVEIILNGRALLSVVFACNPAETMRIAIKNSPYPLKNISSVKTAGPLLSEMQLQLSLWISSYYYASLGVVLQAMLRPLGIKSTSKKLPTLAAIGLHGNPIADERKKQTTRKATLFLGDLSDKTYANIISSAKSAQTLVLVPERKDIEMYEKKFRETVPSADIRLFHSGMKLTQQRAIAKDTLQGMPLVVIGTRSAIFLPFKNLGMIIVENPSDPSHTSWDQNPHLNTARAAARLYENDFCSLLFHEETPGIEILQRAQLNGWNIAIPEQKKSSRGRIIDMREELKDGNRSVVSRDLQKMIAAAKENKKPLFLYVQRRGFASGIVCRDCGCIVKCPSCNVPMVYHDVNGKKFLLCHRCEKKLQAPSICPSCRGNRIRFIGAGTQRVEDEVKKLFPDLLICRLDSDADHSAGFLKTFDLDSYDVIIGTSYAWSILPPQTIDYGAIITIDGLLSLPDYRSSERVYGIVEKMKNITRQEYLVQTYCPEAPIFSFAITGNWDAFAKKELGLRKILKWPPYVQIIRMQYAHAQSSTAQTQAQQAHNLLQTQIKSLRSPLGQLGMPGIPREGYPASLELLGPSPAYVDKVKNKFVWEIILKWPVDEKGEAQNLELRNRLLAVLPREWNIDVDPIDLV